ncbi:MAG: DNA mismatch repair protein MutH, partial [Bilophila sp.]
MPLNLYGGTPYWHWIPTPDTPALLFDIETNGLLKQTTTIHCLCAKDFLTGKSFSFGPNQIEEGLKLLATAPLLVAHNGLCFDVPALQKLRPALSLPRLFDTLTASRLIWTDLTGDDFKLRRSLQKRGGDFPNSLMGKHKLEAWGYRLGCYKGDYGKQESAWDRWTPEMQTYCEQDVEVLEKLYRHILKQAYSPEALALEHEFQQVIHRQEQTGVPFNVPAANVLYAELAGKREALKQQLDDVFPPKRIEEVFIPKA